MYLFALIPGIAAVIFFIMVRVKRGGIPGLLAKSVPSFLFILTACASLYANPSASGYGLLIIPGLVCGLMGDIWLDLKYAYPADSEIYLYSGFYTFLAGHIFFITALYSSFTWAFPHILFSSALAAAASAAIIFSEKPLGFRFGKFRGTSFIYGTALMMTTFSSMTAAYLTGETAWYLMSAGGFLFALSDIVLSATYFGEGKDTPPYIISNHLLYYAAQYCIALSVLFA